MAREILLRCSDCAFVNPENAKFCGMCGSRLAYVKSPKKEEDKEPTYDKSILRGGILNSSEYGYKVWQREVFRLVGINIIATIILVIAIIVIAVVQGESGIGPWFWLLLYLLLPGFIFGSACRIYLDAVRGRNVSFGRAIVAGWKNILPATFLVLLIWLMASVAGGLIWLWTIPMEYVDFVESTISSVLAVIFMMIWVIAALVLLLLPMYIWLIFGATLAMCRIVDRKSNPWLALIWAVRRINSNHWDMFKIGMGQVFTQMIGLLICYVGLLATIPLNGITFASAYEWLRLHGEKADEY